VNNRAGQVGGKDGWQLKEESRLPLPLVYEILNEDFRRGGFGKPLAQYNKVGKSLSWDNSPICG